MREIAYATVLAIAFSRRVNISKPHVEIIADGAFFSLFRKPLFREFTVNVGMFINVNVGSRPNVKISP